MQYYQKRVQTHEPLQVLFVRLGQKMSLHLTFEHYVILFLYVVKELHQR